MKPEEMLLPTLSDYWIFMVWYILGCRVQKIFALEYIGNAGIVRLKQTSYLLSSLQVGKVLAAEEKGSRGREYGRSYILYVTHLATLLRMIF